MTTTLDKLLAVNLRHKKISLNHLITLALLSKEELSMSQLAKRLGMTTAAATGHVDRMEANGWVVRTPMEGDRRQLQVSLQLKGALIVDDVFDSEQTTQQ